ncbi:hypothetical protein [Pseudonocardia sp.]|uniref:hypothetical protein n=1 Tax=Pseudonocardia sp. TaxID=60912 RepID=UPI003D14F9F4
MAPECVSIDETSGWPPPTQRDLSVSTNGSGTWRPGTARATAWYQAALAIRERLVALAPDKIDLQRMFFNSCDRLADLAADDKNAAATVDHALQFAVNLFGRDHPLLQAIQRRLDDPGDCGEDQPTH